MSSFRTVICPLWLVSMSLNHSSQARKRPREPFRGLETVENPAKPSENHEKNHEKTHENHRNVHFNSIEDLTEGPSARLEALQVVGNARARPRRQALRGPSKARQQRLLLLLRLSALGRHAPGTATPGRLLVLLALRPPQPYRSLEAIGLTSC